MLFLMNDRVLDVGDVEGVLTEHLSSLTTMPLPFIQPKDVIALGRELFFTYDKAQQHSEAQLKALACLMIERFDVEAALLVKPPKAKSAKDVIVRFACVPLPTLALLNQMQVRDQVSPDLVNRAVWHAAA